MGSRQAIALVAIIVCCACSPPTVQRPLEGAPPVGNGGAAGKEQGSASAGSTPPPTLAPVSPAPAGSPGPGAAGAAGPAPSPSPAPEPGYVIVATDGRGANLRDAPGTSSRVIVTLAEGTAVEVFGDEVTAEGRAWRKIRGGNREGWVLSVVVRRR